MKRLIVGTLAVGAALLGAMACNFMVGGLDDYGRTCQFEGRSATACGVCMQQCQAEIDRVCEPTAKDETAMRAIVGCASDPSVKDYRPYSSTTNWECSAFLDAGPRVPGTDKDSLRKNVFACISEKCVHDEGAAVPPCKTCPLVHTENGVPFPFETSTCGSCMMKAENCYRDVVDCCANSAVSEDLASCAYDLKQRKAECTRVLDYPTPDAGDGGYVSDYAKCALRIRDCAAAHCSNECPRTR